VIIPTLNCRAVAERAVQSALAQNDPIGVEVVVADAGSRDGTPDHLESVFSQACAEGRLRVLSMAGTSGRGGARDWGAGKSQGSFLTFLNPADLWRPGHLDRLEPWLSGHDLILGAAERVPSAKDFVRSFLRANWAVSSASVVRRTLFEEAGGFGGGTDYELWLKCALRLLDSERRERIAVLANESVVVGAPVVELPMLKRLQAARDLATVVQLAPRVPRRYWGVVAGRVIQAIRRR
jgi:glycosyltransferase involved in cell wall biosynthesis